MQTVFDKMQDALGADLLGYGLLLAMLCASSVFAIVLSVNSLRTAPAPRASVPWTNKTAVPDDREPLDWAQPAGGGPWYVRKGPGPLSSYQGKRLLKMVQGRHNVAYRLIQLELARGASSKVMAAEWAADRLERERGAGAGSDLFGESMAAPAAPLPFLQPVQCRCG